MAAIEVLVVRPAQVVRGDRARPRREQALDPVEQALDG